MAVNKYGVDVDELRDELKDIERRSARGPYWTPQVGKNIVRILPAWAEGKRFYHKVWGHWVRAQSTSYPCLNKMKGEKCPLCEEVERLRATGDRKHANALSASLRYYLQVIDRKNPEAGVQIFNTGSTVFKGIAALLNDEDWGPGLLDIQKGYDIVIERTGEGLDTDYPSIRARKDPSPAGVGVESLIDLESIVDFRTADEMRSVLTGDTSSEGTDSAEGDASASKGGKPECYGQYDADAEKCKDCASNFDCEIDTPAK